MTSTSRTHRLAIAVAALAVTGLAGAGPASADTYCVAKPACSGAVQPDVQAALTAAAVSPVPDRIEVGPGSFSTTDGFVYLGAGADNTVELVGAGRYQTELRGGTGVNDRPTLLLQGSAPAKVSDLTISTPSAISPLYLTGLRIFGDAKRIAVQTGAFSDGVDLLAGSSLESSSVSLGGRGDAVTSTAGAASVRDARLDGHDGNAAGAKGAGSLSVSHSTLTAGVGAFAQNGATIEVDNSLILPKETGLYAYESGAATASVAATNVTIVGTDPSVTAIQAYGVNPGSSAKVAITNTVIARTTKTLTRSSGNGGVASIVASHSAYDRALIAEFGAGTIDQSAANLNLTTPGFVDLDGDDFHLLADSPLRDAGAAAPPAGLAATDLAGKPRSVDGNADGTAAPDIGAFEFQPPPPPTTVEPPVVPPVTPPVVPPVTPPVITSAALTHGKFAVGRAPRRGTAFRVGLSEDATVNIVIRRPKHRAGTLKRRSHKGANRIAFSGRIGKRALRPGRYVATVTATDAADRRSAARTLRFTVLKG